METQTLPESGQVDPDIKKLSKLSEIFKQSWQLWRSRMFVSNMLLLIIVAFSILPLLFSFSKPLTIISVIIEVAIYIVVGSAYNVLYLNKENLSTSEVLRKTYPLIKSYLWVGLLAMLIGTAGFILFILPGIWVSVLIGFGYLSLFDRGYKGFNALAHSWYLVRGKWWRLFLYGCVFILGIFIIAGTVSALLGLPFSDKVEEEIFNLLSLILVPYISAFSVALYQSLKATKKDITTEEIHTLSEKMKKLLWGSLIVIAAFVGLVIFLLIKFPPNS